MLTESLKFHREQRRNNDVKFVCRNSRCVVVEVWFSDGVSGETWKTPDAPNLESNMVAETASTSTFFAKTLLLSIHPEYLPLWLCVERPVWFHWEQHIHSFCFLWWKGSMVNRFLHPVERKNIRWAKITNAHFRKERIDFFTYSSTSTRARLFTIFLPVVSLCRHAHKVDKRTVLHL